ncbi:MAG TPA: hypothetical protein VKV69_03230, partial [Actinomycetota bacterium]|nr:hypothetical protein [Actinomycetota bacterium]
VMLGLGFASIGSPSTQRMLRADQKRVQDLYQVSDKIHNLWTSQHKLPEHLDALMGVPLADPITRLPYEYNLKSETSYELCATFAAASADAEGASRARAWAHPAGKHCFPIDVEQMPDNPDVYYPY